MGLVSSESESLILFFGHVQRSGYSRETEGPIFQGAMCKYAYDTPTRTHSLSDITHCAL